MNLLQKRIVKNLLIVFFLQINLVAFCQEYDYNSLTAKPKDEIKNNPQHINISIDLLEKYFYEVHNGSPYKFNPDIQKIYLEQLSRIEIIFSPYVENPYMPKLSSIGKMDKYNPNLNFDVSNFNPDSFNFIKYGFNFYSTSDQFIRVDQKDYIIHILPYNNK